MMRNKKIILALSILFVVSFSVFAAKKGKTSKQTKQVTSADFVYFSGVNNEEYAIRHVGFDFTAFLSGGKNLPKILDFGKTKGYSLTSLNYDDGVKDVKMLFILCNIFSEMDGLEPAYKKMDGTPVKTENDFKSFIYTSPSSGGWYLPTESRFYVATVYDRPSSVPRTSGFENGCGAWQYYYRGDSSSSYMAMGFSMKRSMAATKTIPVKTVNGSFKSRYYIKPFEVAIVDSPTLLEVFESMAKNGYVANEKVLNDGGFVGPNGKLTVRELGINDEIFCNMLSEAMGFVPVYYDYDGNIYKKSEEENYYNRRCYEQHTNGWRKPTSDERSIVQSAGIKDNFYVRNNER